MPKLLHFAALWALTGSSLFGPVSIVPCQVHEACPMHATEAAGGHGGHCDPGPVLDCCTHDRTPPARDLATADGVQLGAVVAVEESVGAATPAPPPPRLRATAVPTHGDRAVPLYTLHATLLI